MTRDEAIIKYQKFAEKVARRWWRKKPYMRDDMQATALYALVKAFDHRIPPTDIECRKYLTVCIGNAIKDFLQNDHLIRVPRDAENIFVALGDYPPSLIAHRVEIKEFLDTLTAQDRQILQHVADGHTQSQTAALMGISQGYVCKRLEKIRRRYEKA